HASYYMRGEYLAELELPFLMPLVAFSDRIARVWHRFVQRYSYHDEPTPEEPRTHFNIFRVPFVDYARGDGISIGPGQDHEWDEPELLNPVPGWALHYRGLWGLYTRDAFSGEDAPAGPVYTRRGEVRKAWYDPVGWSGLDKVPPPDEALSYVLAQRAEVDARRAELAEEIEVTSRELAGM